MKRYLIVISFDAGLALRVTTDDTSSVGALRGVLGLLDPAAVVRRAEVRRIA